MDATPRDETEETRLQIFVFYILIVGVGLATGAASSVLHAGLDAMHTFRHSLRTSDSLGTLPAVIIAGLAAAALTCGGTWLVRRFAPDTAGSGIPEIIETLRGDRTLDWRRVIPVKLGAGLAGIGSGLVLGREGPTIHLGGAMAAMIAEITKMSRRNTLAAITAGAGAGLAAAFNAPLAGIIFVTEEMRRVFDFKFRSFQAVILACVVATMVNDRLFSQGPILDIPHYRDPAIIDMLLMLPLGIFIGAFGVLLNAGIVNRVKVFAGLPQRVPYLWAALVGGIAGVLVILAPTATGGGEGLVVADITVHPGAVGLFVLFLARSLMLMASYSSGVPGGLFAPMLSIGTAIGLLYGAILTQLGLISDLPVGIFAVAGMGALFAAMVRAPLTGIVIVVEMTGATDLILSIMVTSILATFTAETLGGKPIYSQLTKRKAGEEED
ncbi:H(+)/Cl(-) exchange transporter ClcA [Chachezhania antarctica]|uniref:H(+)/Cl(-) exchange transporter ClcA n=1 Tax=Chachezhania antarctica TaxID=2340860 RepID=UPI000EB3DEC2|nr:H(+)/Cl(-) exchange transporter ClcA [Chachezhania antarctica]|tara:strand:+ start:607 stop:1923 length:1317 start_codon:yes stop_codon:yes gene_type:complete